MKKNLQVLAVTTSILGVGDDLLEFVIKNLKRRTLKERDILVITSKIVSLAESAIIFKAGIDKDELVRSESDVYLGKVAYGCHLTIKDGLLIPSAGIDESNASGDFYILYPRRPYVSAHKIWKALRQHFKIKKLGIILSDSHTSPLRKGVTGITLAHWGFSGVTNMIGSKDLFGRKLKMTQINNTDALAAMAVLVMGEGNEKCPLAIIKNAPVTFAPQTKAETVAMPLRQDLYYPLIKRARDLALRNLK